MVPDLPTCLVKDCTLNHMRDLTIIEGMFLKDYSLNHMRDPTKIEEIFLNDYRKPYEGSYYN